MNPDADVDRSLDPVTPDPIRRRLLSGLLLALLLYLAVHPYYIHVFAETWNYVGMDFPIFYTAAEKVRKGESPYPAVVEVSSDDPAKRSWGGYIYPPFFALLLAPLTSLDPVQAKQVFTLLSVALFFYLLWPPEGPGGVLGPQRLSAFFLLFLWGPAIDTLRFGQSNLVTLFLICGSLAVIRRGPERGWSQAWIEFVSGALVGASAMVKLTSGIIVPIALVLGAWRFCVGFFTGMLFVGLATHPGWNWDYFVRILPTLRDFPQYDVFFSVHQAVREILIVFTPFGLDRSWAEREGAHAGLAVSGLMFAAILVLCRLRRDRLSEEHAILLGCYLAPLLAGEKFHHYTLALLPALHAVRSMSARTVFYEESGAPVASSSRAVVTVRLVVLLIALSPNFYFNWMGNWLHHHFRESTGLTSNLLIAVGNLVAFLVILPELLGPRNGRNDSAQGEGP